MQGTTGDAPGGAGDAVGQLPDATLYDTAAALFRDWHAGRAGALDELVRLLSPVLWHVVRASGLDHETAEDVVQNTWLTLVASADSVRDPQAVTRWLCTAARREAWRVGRAASRTRPTDDEAIDARLPLQRSPEQDAVLHDEQAQLWHALGRLPERCQKLLRIVAAEPRPDYSSVAAGLQMPVGSIGPTRRRCLDKLRNELDGGAA